MTDKFVCGALTRNKGKPTLLFREKKRRANILSTHYYRIGKANVLVAGMRSLSDEVCKNLALAGVASITLLDHENVTEYDLGAQFFLNETSVGKNVGVMMYQVKRL
jgi:molybdopterin/thiamine biosynthesis adenylyltransferase